MTNLKLAEVIFSDQRHVDRILCEYSFAEINKQYDHATGRLTVTVSTSMQYDGYFVDSDGLMYPMELIHHAYPSGKTFNTLVPIRNANPIPRATLTYEIWSCDPADIPAWTEEGKQRLHNALAQIFNWPDSPTPADEARLDAVDKSPKIEDK